MLLGAAGTVGRASQIGAPWRTITPATADPAAVVRGIPTRKVDVPKSRRPRTFAPG
jgi:hypothetical protein